MQDRISVLTLRHLKYGWCSFSIYLALGLMLEGLHGFKADWYLGDDGATRRLMFTLAHAHGALFGLAHIVLAVNLRFLEHAPPARLFFSSYLFTVGSILLPLGFFLGGIQTYGGDPGVLVLLSPIGALLLVSACCLFTICVLSLRATDFGENQNVKTPDKAKRK